MISQATNKMGNLGPVYPVSLVLVDEPCLVVGGGRVAARKVEGLLAAKAQVHVVAPVTSPEIDSLETSGHIHVERRPYREGEAAPFRFVITATGDRSVDGQVAHDARSAGIWVNSADDPANCSVLLPAIHRDGAVSIAVSTGGAAPALASWLRTQVATVAGVRIGALAELLHEARTQVHAQGRSTESVDWMALLDGGIPELVRDGNVDEARARIERAIADAFEGASHANV